MKTKTLLLIVGIVLALPPLIMLFMVLFGFKPDSEQVTAAVILGMICWVPPLIASELRY
jgi:hypothetical protein